MNKQWLNVEVQEIFKKNYIVFDDVLKLSKLLNMYSVRKNVNDFSQFKLTVKEICSSEGKVGKCLIKDNCICLIMVDGSYVEFDNNKKLRYYSLNSGIILFELSNILETIINMDYCGDKLIYIESIVFMFFYNVVFKKKSVSDLDKEKIKKFCASINNLYLKNNSCKTYFNKIDGVHSLCFNNIKICYKNGTLSTSLLKKFSNELSCVDYFSLYNLYCPNIIFDEYSKETYAITTCLIIKSLNKMIKYNFNYNKWIEFFNTRQYKNFIKRIDKRLLDKTSIRYSYGNKDEFNKFIDKYSNLYEISKEEVVVLFDSINDFNDKHRSFIFKTIKENSKKVSEVFKFIDIKNFNHRINFLTFISLIENVKSLDIISLIARDYISVSPYNTNCRIKEYNIEFNSCFNGLTKEQGEVLLTILAYDFSSLYKINITKFKNTIKSSNLIDLKLLLSLYSDDKTIETYIKKILR